jgi:radical SAM/Cys-rich protein
MEFKEKILSIRPEPLTANGIDVLQVNLGYRCNMSCRHCHVAAGPGRSETMQRETIEAVLGALTRTTVGVIDITGGAPELNSHFRYLVDKAKSAGCRIIVRTNLTIFSEKGMEDLPEFYRDNKVDIVASVPCYLEANVDAVRGEGAFKKTMRALERLNKLGYGNGSLEMSLSLVYNPAGPFLPPPQKALEADYRRELWTRFGITFTSLYTFTNMPIGRFRDFLVRRGELERYLGTLRDAFNPEVLDGLMCRRMISVGWDGMLYDCDFNQMLGLGMHADSPQHVKDFDHERLSGRMITVGEHCYGCTAGQGST